MIKRIRAVLVDINGTLLCDNEVVPGAVEAWHRLRSQNLHVRLVNNVTRKPERIILSQLHKLGFVVNYDEIFSSLSAAKYYIIRDKLKPMLILNDEALEDFRGLDLRKGEKPNAVVVGLSPSKLNYKTLNEAFQYLLDGARLLQIHESKYYKRRDGLALGPGGFVKGLEFSSGVQSETLGKPNPKFFRYALGHFDPDESVMIGDDVYDDIAGSMKAGLHGFLVQTGKYRPKDEDKIYPIIPTKVCLDFPHAVNLLMRQI